MSVHVIIDIFIVFLLFYSYDWFQTDSLITIIIYTKQKVSMSLKPGKIINKR